ncbi:MAG: hypothetical protein NUV63_01145 [Gallionella sp.]|nr:hypothetical protein [Gallionella sp.]
MEESVFVLMKIQQSADIPATVLWTQCSSKVVFYIFRQWRPVMLEDTYSATDSSPEDRAPEQNLAVTKCFSGSAGTFVLRRRRYFNETRFNGIEQRVLRAGFAKAGGDAHPDGCIHDHCDRRVRRS